MSKDKIEARKADHTQPTSEAGLTPANRPVIALRPEDVALLARREQVPEVQVKAAMQAFGSDRAKVVATLRSRKTTLH